MRLVTSSGACGHTGGCLCEGNRGSLTVVDFCYKVGSEVMINLSGRSDPGTCVCVCVCEVLVDVQRCCSCCSVELQQVYYAVRRERSDGDTIQRE